MKQASVAALRNLVTIAGGLLLGACMGDGECPVYEYDPDAIRVTFRDADTGEILCGKPNVAKPGKLYPIGEDECAYDLVGWYSRGDAGEVSTTVELTVGGYVPVTETFLAGTGSCGEPTAPGPQEFVVTPDPDADD